MLINQSINLFEDYHGYQGPIKVTDAEETPKITEALLKAVQDIGESITDVNGKEQKGEPPFFQNGHVCIKIKFVSVVQKHYSIQLRMVDATQVSLLLLSCSIVTKQNRY